MTIRTEITGATPGEYFRNALSFASVISAGVQTLQGMGADVLNQTSQAQPESSGSSTASTMEALANPSLSGTETEPKLKAAPRETKTIEAQAVSLADVQGAVSGLLLAISVAKWDKAKGRKYVEGILSAFGAKKASEVGPENRAAFIDAAIEATKNVSLGVTLQPDDEPEAAAE